MGPSGVSGAVSFPGAVPCLYPTVPPPPVVWSSPTPADSGFLSRPSHRAPSHHGEDPPGHGCPRDGGSELRVRVVPCLCGGEVVQGERCLAQPDCVPFGSPPPSLSFSLGQGLPLRQGCRERSQRGAAGPLPQSCPARAAAWPSGQPGDPAALGTGRDGAPSGAHLPPLLGGTPAHPAAQPLWPA